MLITVTIVNGKNDKNGLIQNRKMAGVDSVFIAKKVGGESASK